MPLIGLARNRAEKWPFAFVMTKYRRSLSEFILEISWLVDVSSVTIPHRVMIPVMMNPKFNRAKNRSAKARQNREFVDATLNSIIHGATRFLELRNRTWPLVTKKTTWNALCAVERQKCTNAFERWKRCSRWFLAFRNEEIEEIVKKTKHAMRIRDIGVVFECRFDRLKMISICWSLSSQVTTI